MSRQEAFARVRAWREHPMAFVTQELKAEPDAWQARVLEGLADPAAQRMAMQACSGPGKTAVLAWAGWHFLACQGERGEHPKGAAVSVTADNLKDNLWPEMAKWQQRSRFLSECFAWTKERIVAVDHPETWFLSARSWSKTANAEEQGRTLSGMHSRYVLYLIDESGDIAPAVLRAAEQGLSRCAWGKILQAGNPTSLEGMLYASVVRQAHLWRTVRITGDPEDPQRSPRIDRAWAQEQIRLYGRDNPWVMAYVLGQFPPSSINALLGPEEVEAAMGRALRPEAYEFAQKRLGIDAARFGDDPWVIVPRQGLASFRPVELRHPRSQEVAARVAQAKQRWGSELECFDGTGGYAAGAIDAMIQAGYAPLEVSFAGRALDPRYSNKRSEMWFEMAEWVKRGGALARCGQYLRELTAPTFTFFQGKFRLEEKEQIKKRLGFSPNYGDALALTFAMPEQASAERTPRWMRERAAQSEHEYEPLDSARLEALVG
jgi:hypothetical protein